MRGLWYVQLVQVRTKCRSPQTRESNAEANAESNAESNAECINSNNSVESNAELRTWSYLLTWCISNAFADLEPGECLCRGQSPRP